MTIDQVPSEAPEPLPIGNGFLNPYAFVSIPDRAELPKSLSDCGLDSRLAGKLAGHDRYHADRWTGTIGVTITTRTPMLIPDHGRRAATSTNADEPLEVRVDHKGRPMLAGSAVKGALRSAYEMITNSRFGVFQQDRQMAIRSTVDESLADLRPAVVLEVGDDTATLQVVESLTPHHLQGKKLERPVQTAVWSKMTLRCECTGGCSGKIGHGTDGAEDPPRSPDLEAWIYFARLGKFPLWRVAALAEPGKLCDKSTARQRRSEDIEREKKRTRGLTIDAQHDLVKVRGRLHRTGSTFPAGGERKRYERFVVTQVLGGPADAKLTKVTVDKQLLDGWQATIDSYHQAHHREKDTHTRYGQYVWQPQRWRQLRPHDTLYVRIEEVDSAKGRTIQANRLFPAMVGRVPFAGTPEQSLPEAHRPAKNHSELSPADRVFGWVGQDGRRGDEGPAYRGHLRVLPPHESQAPDPSSVHRIGGGLQLVALNSPKPSQFRFYLGDRDGKPLNGVAKDADEGYPAEPGRRRLRGRKVYLTHAEVLYGQHSPAYWNPPAADGTGPLKPDLVHVKAGPRYREYARTPVRDGDKDNVDVITSVSQWVKQGTKFRLTLQVDNLTDTELGALLWLLWLPEGACLKLGLGKPLGFGAVRAEVNWDDTRLFHGDRLRERYRLLSRSPEPVEVSAVRQLIDDYDALLREHLPTVRTEFLNAAYGFLNAPVHYPRAADTDKEHTPPQPGQPSTPRNTTYDWWVTNDAIGEKDNRPKDRRLALGELSNPENLVLPYHPMKKERNAGGKGGGNGGNGKNGGGGGKNGGEKK
ncbi:RAMP superfamily CRISPR-associated protein [Solwaraspora sp. WMMD792]|uniref:RAMP superfamily CRISPR-associated protein n=1 Tax=Solwaraspora sp. WMMD792 TaxID=3016099 RepID=UPI00241716F2|nr:RAMP superfamily CRISPR-associated protein [Solwaraspora sp. WMMD792]MDG4771954.1 RAMP superfamily CRISPR-associated protein [Solwaraspora sp. WMMD792]